MKSYFDTLINTDQVSDLIHSGIQIVFLDCRYALDDPFRGRKDYLQSHIPSAVYMDIMHDLSSPVIKGITGRHPLPNPVILESALQQAGISNDSQVIVYDQNNGAYAARAWWLLQWLGHEKVALLNGGFASWISEGNAVDNQWSLPETGTFKGNINEKMTIAREALQTVKKHIVDSRDARRYSGEIEPIDPVAGHIPGAICIPFMQNTGPDGKWISKDALQERFHQLENPVFYCGSGVTACHNVLAFKMATGRMAQLYPGSWSEWILYHKPDTGS